MDSTIFSMISKQELGLGLGVADVGDKQVYAVIICLNILGELKGTVSNSYSKKKRYVWTSKQRLPCV